MDYPRLTHIPLCIYPVTGVLLPPADRSQLPVTRGDSLLPDESWTQETQSVQEPVVVWSSL